MKKYFGLTNTEAEIMSLFWDFGKDAFTFRELSQYAREFLEKDWKKQTLSTFLSNLQKMGLLEVKVKGRNYIYYSVYSRQEYINQWARDLIRTQFCNSLSTFVAAFTSPSVLSKEETDHIRKLLDSDD